MPRLYWTEERNAKLTKLYPYVQWMELRRTFDNRSVDSIRKQASRLGLRRAHNVEDAFVAKIDFLDGLDACWEWCGHIKENGYGQFQADGQHCYAHRFAYEFYVGPIDVDLTVDHKCKNRKCVRPSHLQLLTRAENTLAGDSPLAINARRTKCVNGHILDDDNVYMTSKGERKCRYCSKLRDRRRYADHKKRDWQTRKDTHDYFDDALVENFLRQHRTGVDNLGRQTLARIVAQYDNPVVLDCAAGTAVNWEVFQACGVTCRYIAFDRTKKLLDHAKKLYGDSIEYIEGYAQELSIVQQDVDIVIIRHLLEHLPYGDYEDIVRQAIELANHEVVLVFFLDLSSDDSDSVEHRGPDERGCYHWWNTYSQRKLMEFLTQFGYQIKGQYVRTPGAAHADTIIRIIK